MRRLILSVVALVCLVSWVPASAQNSAQVQKKTVENVPPILVAGLQAYKEKGPEEAIKAWLKGSPIEDDRDALSQALMLQRIQGFYGKYEDYDVIATRSLTPRMQTIYLVMNFEKGPLFGRFITYRTEQGWIMTSFNFNTNSGTIFPGEESLPFKQ